MEKVRGKNKYHEHKEDKCAAYDNHMPYAYLEHTADVRMEVTDGTIPGLFEQALRGMFAFLRPVRRRQEAKRLVTVRSPDTAALLVDFLNEALSLAQAHKETYESVRFKKLVEKELTAELRGYKVSGFGEDIKAVTYHEAKVERVPKAGWRAHLLFDI